MEHHPHQLSSPSSIRGATLCLQKRNSDSVEFFFNRPSKKKKMEYTFKPSGRACSTRDEGIDLLCSDNIGEGLPSPPIQCPQTPNSERPRSPIISYPETPSSARSRSPVGVSPAVPSPMRPGEHPNQIQPEGERSPDPYLTQLHKDILAMSSQVENLLIALREKEDDNSILREQVQRQNEELGYSRSQAAQPNTQVGGPVTLEAFQEMEERRTTRLVDSLAVRHRERPVIRLSDVRVLTLAELSSIESKTHLSRFFRNIEATTENDQQRVKSAQIRMEPGVQEVVQEKIQDGITNWSQFKLACHEVYDNNPDIITIMQELMTLPYDFEEDPRHYKNIMEAKIKSMPSTEHKVNALRHIKRNLHDGSPPEIQQYLVRFLQEDGMDLNRFVDMLEKVRNPHRQMARSVRVRELAKVTEGKVATTAANGPPQAVAPVGTNYQELPSTLLAGIDHGQQAIVRAVEALNKSLAESQGRTRKPWCGYCPKGSNSHWPRDCNKKPPYNSCFACLTVGHHKGDTSCPARQA